MIPSSHCCLDLHSSTILIPLKSLKSSSLKCKQFTFHLKSHQLGSEFSDDGNTGVYKTGENYDSMYVLFEFDFTVLPEHASVSIGTYNTDPVSRYQFLVHGTDKFTITVLPTDAADGAVHLYLGKRVIYPSEMTFFQKYGSYIMIGGVFLCKP
jgi:hypothetical protein